MRSQPVTERGEIGISAALNRLALVGRVKAFRFQEICVDEAGEQHARQKRLRESLVLAQRKRRRRPQCRCGRQRPNRHLPTLVLGDGIEGAIQSPAQALGVRQAGVVSGNRGGEHASDGRGKLRGRDPCSSRRMIDAGTGPAQILLDLRSNLADIVQLTGESSHLRPSERGSKLGRRRTDRAAMIRKQFPPFSRFIGNRVGVDVLSHGMDRLPARPGNVRMNRHPLLGGGRGQQFGWGSAATAAKSAADAVLTGADR